MLPPWLPQAATCPSARPFRLLAPSGGGLPSATTASPPSGLGTGSATASVDRGLEAFEHRLGDVSASSRGLTARDVAPVLSRGRRSPTSIMCTSSALGCPVSTESVLILQVKELPNLPGAAPTLRWVTPTARIHQVGFQAKILRPSTCQFLQSRRTGSSLISNQIRWTTGLRGCNLSFHSVAGMGVRHCGTKGYQTLVMSQSSCLAP